MKKFVIHEQGMTQRELLPQGESSRFLESYWESSVCGQVLLAPEGTFYIVYSQMPFILSCHKTYLLQAGFYLFPINTKLISINHSGRLVGIRIKAFTIDNINNGKKIFSEKNDVFWRFNQNLPIINHCETKWEQNIELSQYIHNLNELFYEILSGNFSLNSSLRDKVNYILNLKGHIRINEMANNFNISRQFLHKYFIKHLGISPKQLSNIWKINNYIYLARKQNSLTISALDSGYFDHAHCINEFKKYFNHPPKFLHNKKMDFTLNCIDKRFNNQYDPK